MIKLGLIGFPLSHSFSVQYFSDKFKQENIRGYEYKNYPIQQIGGLEDLIRDEPELLGLNVTIPYKEQVVPWLDRIDETARKIGAVNTLLISREGESVTLEGFNTDVYGFRESLIPLLDPEPGAALVLGTGGASKAIEYVLGELGISCQFVSRRPEGGQLHYRELCLPVFRQHKLIINTTPLGTYPDVSAFPDIPYDMITSEHILYDLVYNPAETRFLKMGREKGATVMNGLKMLELQAEASWHIWTNSQQV